MSIVGVRDVAARAVDLDSPARLQQSSGDFGVQLQAAIADVETTATNADTMGEGLVTGEVDIHEAMVAMEKADLTLRVAGTVRNKVIEAYQTLMQAGGG